MLSSPLGWNRSHRPLKDLQQCLLYALAGNISCNRYILRLLCDLIDLINIDNAMLCPFNIVIGSLDQLQENVFHIFTYITCLRQRSGICNGKRHIDYPRQCLGKKGFSGTGRSQHQNVAFLQFDSQIIACQYPLVMIIHSHRKDLLGLILSDDIIIQKSFQFLRL